MVSTTDNTGQQQAEKLIKRGMVYYKSGDHQTAHKTWQRAAMLDPFNESVWDHLLLVLVDDHDRQVCLRNILTINPNNQTAANMLDLYYEDTQPSQAIKFTPQASPHRNIPRQVLSWLGTALIWGIEAVIVGILLATAIILIIYL